ncbi:MAG TPA: aminodeoxychorismate synthase component I [Steroidobacteraceae bacterium]|nr:aminodeoxychorismate synthase component I [Steroidobacteraceae bacterium]
MIRRELDVGPGVLRQLAVRRPERYPVLLDSAADGPLSQRSVLAAFPTGALWLDAQGRLHAQGSSAAAMLTPGLEGSGSSGFLAALERWIASDQVAGSDLGPSTGVAEHSASLPFCGGWALFLGYELAGEIEPRLALPRAAAPHLWQAFALRVPCGLVHDRGSDKILALAEEGAAAALDAIESDARELAAGAGAAGGAPPPPAVARVSEEEASAYLERVRRGKEYIRAGDIYQTNLSRPWRVELGGEADVGLLYERLRSVNPAPFAALAQWRGGAVLSSSPERLVRVVGRRVETRPIAGTRPRSRQPGEDAREAAALAAHPKERAEHIMLIDLERNDLGRVCEPGTVTVEELMSIESYAHVHHIVSSVTGTLRRDVTAIDVLRAVFPGGTITGCPKYRCMQIIAQLEGEGRGAYTGSLGLLGRDGSMDFNILIRTMALAGRLIEFRAGAGIVADSDPERELEECSAKARGLLAVFGETGRAGAAA